MPFIIKIEVVSTVCEFWGVAIKFRMFLNGKELLVSLSEYELKSVNLGNKAGTKFVNSYEI